jgi:large subunit ribosomal protein L15
VKGSHPVKVLGDGDVVKAYVVKAHAFSASAKTKLEKAGGRAEISSPDPLFGNEKKRDEKFL